MFVSSTLAELAPERAAVRQAIEGARFTPVLFELGARPHPPRDLYRAYLKQSHVFVGIYWQSYGWIAPGMEISGLEDEYDLAEGMPKLVYVKRSDRVEPRLTDLIRRIGEGGVSYRSFDTAEELSELLREDLALLVSERFSWTVPGRLSRAAIPTPVSSLVGREREVEAVVELLSRRETRLLTLTGPGGIGKTRLALEVATALAQRCGKEVAWTELASLHDPRLVTETIAQMLEAGETLTEHIGMRELVLAVDNFEQVIAAAPDLASLLSACPNLTLLVTSRELLRVRGEVEYQVPPLALDEAVALFCARSGLGRSEVVGELCAHLDNLPLAVELAAARTKVLSPSQILERLSPRLDLLTRGPRDADPRQQTLRATIEWSYELLLREEQQLFARLSVFAGGCTLGAAEAVCGADLDALQSLIGKSLLRGSETRWGMLETIREYAIERLSQSGEAGEIRRRHAEWYRDEACEGAMAWFGGTRAEGWEEKVNNEQENIRVALEEFNARGCDVDVVRIIVAVGGHWDTIGFGLECDRWLEIALKSGNGDDRLRARILALAGRRASFRHDAPAAMRFAAEFAVVAKRLGDPLAEASATFDLARAHEVGGDLESAAAEYALAAELFHGRSDLSEAAALANLVGLELVRGRYAEAREGARAALELAESVGYPDAVIGSTMNVGLSYLREGDAAEAKPWLRKALETARRLERVIFVPGQLVMAAEIAMQEAHPERVATLTGAASHIAEAAGVVLEDGFETPAHDLMDRAAQVIGADSVAKHMAEGAALSWPDAVTLALNSLD